MAKLEVVECVSQDPFTDEITGYFYEVIENDDYLYTLKKRCPTKEEAIRYIKEYEGKL